MSWARDVGVAVSFLTRIPVPGLSVIETRDIARSAAWFPLAGVLVGGVQIATLFLTRPLLSPAIAAVFILIADAVVTGGLHLDGLADSADGIGGGRDRARILAIMRDHAIGAYGAIALILALGLKWTVLSEIISLSGTGAVLVVAPVLGRWAGVSLAAALPYVRSEGNSVGRVGAWIGRREWVIATVTALGVAAVLGSQTSGVALLASTVPTLAWGLYCWRRIGGVTGDSLGAAIVLAEISVLVGFRVQAV